jgi:PAS domain S-box-containing protein
VSVTRTRALRVYVLGVVLVAVAMSVAASLASHLTLAHDVKTTVLVSLLVLEGLLLRVRFHYQQQHDDLSFVEVALAVLFVGHTVADVAVVTACVITAGMLIQHVRDWTKAAFNVAMWTLAAVAGAVTYGAVTHALPGNGGRLLAVAAGTLAVIATNQLAFTGAIWLASGRPLGARQPGLERHVVIGRLITATATMAFGVVLAGARMWSPWAVAFAFVPLLLLHWASRGYAETRADRVRLAGLQRITHELSVSMDVEGAVPLFLNETRKAFEATRAELWLSLDGRLTRAYDDGMDNADDEDELRRWLHDILSTNEGASHRQHPAHRSTIVAPLRSGEKTYGALCLFDREGMEGFEDGELAVASALTGELVGFIERAKLVESILDERAKLAQIIDQTSDGILTLSPDGRIRSWNKAIEQITGYFAVEMVGTAHLGLIRPCDESGKDVRLDRWVNLTELPERVQVRTASDETRWLSCSFTRAAGSPDQEEMLIVVARDVTAAHELERLKDDFVAVVSHELRTPLVPIKGWASMLLSRGDRMTAAQQRDALESIQTQAQRLERLVLNILDASRIEGRSDQTGTNVDVSVVAARVVEEMVPTAGTRVVRLHGAGEPHVAYGQAVWIERALANLLANAIKYAPPSTPVEVTVSQEDAEVVVRVTDRGPGIPAAWTERIFERFERVPGTDTQTGTGLGLYITRQLVTAMGGRVEVEPSEGRGTIFTMRLRAGAPLPNPRPGTTFGSVTIN